MAFLGSSNLTLAGLSKQGELNTEISDYDACQKLKAWFEDRWDDRWCVDITEDLIEVIENSWAREEMLSPYELYLKIAYHLAQEARAGLNEFKLPPELADQLLDYQAVVVLPLRFLFCRIYFRTFYYGSTADTNYPGRRWN